PDVPDLLKDVVVRSMAKKAPDRYPPPLAFKDAIETAMGKLPTNEDFAAYLLDFFPQGEETRAARRREIDAGIADFVRRNWEMNPSARMPALSPQAIAAATARAPAPAPAPAPANDPDPDPDPDPARARAPTAAAPIRHSPPRRRADDYNDAPPPRDDKRPSRAPIIAVAALGVAAVAIMWSVSRTPTPAPVAKPHLPPVVVVDAGPPDAGQAVRTQAPPVEPTPPPKPEDPPWLELSVEPAVDISIDGKPAGRSPVRQPLSAGRHVITLSDKKKGISTSRVVFVRAKGKTSEEFSLGKGTLNLSAPEGAVVYLDGERLGYAPIREVPIWEGNHRIVVAVGKAKWEESFYVKANQPVSFNVHTD
ncbi:MAG: PEGA domain-containing protein, partial [Myxococcaceae bacterium]